MGSYEDSVFPPSTSRPPTAKVAKAKASGATSAHPKPGKKSDHIDASRKDGHIGNAESPPDHDSSGIPVKEAVRPKGQPKKTVPTASAVEPTAASNAADEPLPKARKEVITDWEDSQDILTANWFGTAIDLTPGEQQADLDGIEAEGECLDPVPIWEERRIPLGGFHRLEYCRRNDLPCRVLWISLPDEDRAREWAIRYRLNRQGSLNANVVRFLRGALYESMKRRQGERQTSRNGKNSQILTTAQQLGAEFAIDEKTIRNDSDFNRWVTTLAEISGLTVQDRILSGEVKLTQTDLKKVASLIPSLQKTAVAELLKNGKILKPKIDRPAVTALEKAAKAWGELGSDDRKSFLGQILTDDAVSEMLREIREEIESE